MTGMRVLDETGRDFFKNFKGYNRTQGVPFAEVLPHAKTLPALVDRLAIFNPLLLRYFWFFSTDDASPAAPHIKSWQSGFNDILNAQGQPPIF
jgi:hypothetical protein